MFHVCPQNLIRISSVRIKDLSTTLRALFWVLLHRADEAVRVPTITTGGGASSKL